MTTQRGRLGVHAPGLARSARIYGGQHGVGDMHRAGLRRGADPGHGSVRRQGPRPRPRGVGAPPAASAVVFSALDLPLRALRPLRHAWSVY
jgi:hypothetical protein